MAFIGSLLNSNPLVDSATTDDERPTPGHIYRELISLSFQGPAVCERLCKHILVKLALPSAAVKLKSLLVCQQLLEKGNPHFQKELQHNVNSIRACLEFRGPPDPVRGDAVYKAVRDKAAALLNQIYEVKDPSATQEQQSYEGVGSTSLSNIASQHMSSAQSFGNQSNNNTTTLGGSNHTMHLGSGTNIKFMTNTNYQGSNPENKTEIRNTGFGSPAPVEESKLAYVAGMAQNVLTQIGTTLNITKNETPVVVDKGRYVAPIIGGGLRPVTPGQTSTSTYASPNSSNNQPTSLTQLSQERPIASGPMGGWEQVSRERTVTSGMSNTVEYSIIDQFCNPGVSQQANPSRLQISQFLSRIQKDDVRMEVIYYLLQEQLSNQEWKRKLRALYAIHELIVNNVPLAAHYFSDQGLASVLALTTSVQKTLQEKAIQIIQIISPQSLTQPTPEPIPEVPLANTNTTANNQGVASIFSSLSISDTSQQNDISFQPRKISQNATKHPVHHHPSQQQQHYVKPPSQTNPQFQSQPAQQQSLFGFPTTSQSPSNIQPIQDNSNNLFFNLQTTQPQPQPQPQSQQSNIFDEILFPNQKSLLGSQSLIDPEPAPKTNDPNNIFFSNPITSSPPHNNTTSNASFFDLSFYAQPQLQSPITFPSNSNLGYSSPSSTSSAYSSNGRNNNPAFSPSTPYSGPYSSNPRKLASSNPTISNQKSSDPFYFGDIKTLDLNLS